MVIVMDVIMILSHFWPTHRAEDLAAGPVGAAVVFQVGLHWSCSPIDIQHNFMELQYINC